MELNRASLINAAEELLFCYIQGEPLTQPMTDVYIQTESRSCNRTQNRVSSHSSTKNTTVQIVFTVRQDIVIYFLITSKFVCYD